MKLLIVLFLTGICCFALLGYNSYWQNQTEPASHNDAFKAQLNKSEYLLLEPLVVELSLPDGQGGMSASLARSVSILVHSKDGQKEFDRLTHYFDTVDPEALPSRPLSLLSSNKVPDKSQKGDVAELIVDRIDEFFPEAGTYGVQFVASVEGKKLMSDVKTIRIVDPVGTERQAYNVLKKYERPLTFDWMWSSRDGLDALKNFVKSYGNTVYGDFAILSLASAYFAKGDVDRAKKEFEKIRNSEIGFIGKSATKALREIEERTAAPRKQN